MPATKSETLTIRLRPGIKAILSQTAELENRSLANMLEVMIRDYPGREGNRSQPPQGYQQEVIGR